MNMKKWMILFLSSVFLISLNAYGLKNVSNSNSFSLRPYIAINNDGVIMVVWAENANEKDYGTHIYYRIYEKGIWHQPMPTGLTWKAAWTPILSVDSDGNFHLTWADGLTSSAREIYHSMYKHGSGWTGRDMIYYSPKNSSWPKIDIDGDRVHIAWGHRHTGRPGGDIVEISKKIADTGWPADYERLSYSPNDFSNHPCFKVMDDKIHVCYMEGIGEKPPWRLRYKEAMRGSDWKNVPQVTLFESGYYPELDLDHKGNVHVVWGSRQQNFYYKQKIGNSWRGTEVISNANAPRQMGDIRFGSGVLVATFVQISAGLREAYYCAKTLQGDWSSPVKLAEGEEVYNPKVWIDNNASAHFVWQDIKGRVTDIFYEKVDVTPPDPFIKLNPESLSFTIEGANPDPVNLLIGNIGKASLDYEVKTDQDWLSITPTSGKLGQGEEENLQCAVDALDLDEGTYLATIVISSDQAINSPRNVRVTLEVLAPPIFPPLNFSVDVLENKALLYREYVHHLTWEPNPENRDIVSYTLFQVNGENYEFLVEVPSSTHEYAHRNIKLDKTYMYELWAVDDEGRTGIEPATLTVSGTTSTEKNDLKNRIR